MRDDQLMFPSLRGDTFQGNWNNKKAEDLKKQISFWGYLQK